MVEEVEEMDSQQFIGSNEKSDELNYLKEYAKLMMINFLEIY